MSANCERKYFCYGDLGEYACCLSPILLLRFVIYDLPKSLLLFAFWLTLSSIYVIPANLLIVLASFVYDLFYLPVVVIQSGAPDTMAKICMCLVVPIILPVISVISIIYFIFVMITNSLMIAGMQHFEAPCRICTGFGLAFDGGAIKSITDQVKHFYDHRMDFTTQEEFRLDPGPITIRFPICNILVGIPMAIFGGTVTLLAYCINAAIILPISLVLCLPGYLLFPLINKDSLNMCYCWWLILPLYYIFFILVLTCGLTFAALLPLISFIDGIFVVGILIPLNGVLFTDQPWLWIWFVCVQMHYTMLKLSLESFLLPYKHSLCGLDDCLICDMCQDDGHPDLKLLNRLEEYLRKLNLKLDDGEARGNGGFADDVAVNVPDINPMAINNNNQDIELGRQNSDEEIKVQYFSGIFKTIPSSNHAQARLNLSVVWNSFFNQCYTQGIHAINSNYVKLSEFQDNEPYLFIGLPGLVIYVCAYRSATEVETPGLVLTSGVEITDENRPGGPIGDRFWKPAIDLKNLIKKSNITAAENSFIQYSILKQDVSEEKAKELLSEYGEERKKLLNEIIAKVNSMAINVSRLARYTRRFRIVMQRLGNHNNVGLVLDGNATNGNSMDGNTLAAGIRRMSMERDDSNNNNNNTTDDEEIEITSV